MSQSSDADEEVVEIAELAPTVPKWGTIVGRVLLGCLVVLLVIEAHGKFGYDRTLAALREKATKIAGDPIRGAAPELEEWSLPLADAEKCVSGFASKTRRVVLLQQVISLKWFSLFKTYVIQLQLDDENVVTGLSTDEGE